MSNSPTPRETQDIPDWLISINRQLLRLCKCPGHYTLSIHVNAHRPHNWTYTISHEQQLLRKVQTDRGNRG